MPVFKLRPSDRPYSFEKTFGSLRAPDLFIHGFPPYLRGRMTINERQDEIIEEFAFFEDWMERYEHIIELGKELEPLDEQHKLDDCNKEIEIYRQQLQSASESGDRYKEELEDAKENYDKAIKRAADEHKKEQEEVVQKLTKEREEIVQKMTLEHELELESLRESIDQSNEIGELKAEILRLKSELTNQEEAVAALKRKTRIMENTQEEKFHLEKERIVQILEAGFAQRERLSLQKMEADMEAKHKHKIAEMETSHAKALKEGRQYGITLGMERCENVIT